MHAEDKNNRNCLNNDALTFVAGILDQVNITELFFFVQAHIMLFNFIQKEKPLYHLTFK